MITDPITFNPSPAISIVIPPPAVDHVRSLVHQATIIHGGSRGRHTGMFTTAAFAVAVAQRFEVKVPGDDWCGSVLSGVAWVTKMPGPGDYWKVQTG